MGCKMKGPGPVSGHHNRPSPHVIGTICTLQPPAKGLICSLSRFSLMGGWGFFARVAERGKGRGFVAGFPGELCRQDLYWGFCGPNMK